ncbi:hypothetical protein C0J52_18343 [Blattella germanica]|nr:hypothetical protein C0J52_18343 [Blattella germanica]
MEISDDKFSVCSLTDWEANENEYKHYLTNPHNWNKIPCWKSVALTSVMGQKLLRFTGMVQDMLNPEIYLQQYEENETLIEDSVHIVTGERQTLYCISVPALNSWVKLHHNRISNEEMICGAVRESKRPHPDDELSTHNRINNEEMVCEEVCESKRPHPDDEPSTSEGSSSVTEPSAKRVCQTFQPLPSPDNKHDIELTLPLPDSQAVACLVKVNSLSIVGFISTNSNSIDNDVEMEEDHDPDFDNHPRSVVGLPTLHAVAIRKLQHCNPLLSPVLDNTDDILAMAKSIRQELQFIFSQALLGDQMAADYMICHLISGVFQRSDLMSLGQLTLNLTKVPIADGYCSKFYNLLEKLLTKTHYVALTVDNLNKSNFIPRKDYKKNRLHSGMLQLSANTQLVFDETCMEPGRLDSNGLNNMRALEELITKQLVDYDFQYYKLKFNTDLSILILSEGKSLLSSDVVVPLDIDTKCLETRNEIFQAINHYLQEPLLEKIRKYITTVRLLDYTLPKDLEKYGGIINTRSKEYQTIVSAQYLITQVNTTGVLVLPTSRGHCFTARELTPAATIADETPVKKPTGGGRLACERSVIQDDFVSLRRETGSQTTASYLHFKLVLARISRYFAIQKCFFLGFGKRYCEMVQENDKFKAFRVIATRDFHGSLPILFGFCVPEIYTDHKEEDVSHSTPKGLNLQSQPSTSGYVSPFDIAPPPAIKQTTTCRRERKTAGASLITGYSYMKMLSESLAKSNDKKTKTLQYEGKSSQAKPRKTPRATVKKLKQNEVLPILDSNSKLDFPIGNENPGDKDAACIFFEGKFSDDRKGLTLTKKNEWNTCNN